jgi:flagellar hook assembly protein FlgD
MAGLSTIGDTPSFRNPGAVQTQSADDRLNITREQFFSIMIAELRHQDPMEPMDQQQFLGQLAQLESLASQTKMTAGIEQLTSALRFGHLNDAASMLGKVITGSVRQQAIDESGRPRFDGLENPIYEDVPVEGLASRVVTEGGATSVVLLVPIIGNDGQFVTDPNGGILTREIAVKVESIREIFDPMIGADAVAAPGQ